MFDCGDATRNARNGWLFTLWRHQVEERKFRDDQRPLGRIVQLLHLPQLQQPTVSSQQDCEILGAMLNMIHNLHHHPQLTKEMRE